VPTGGVTAVSAPDFIAAGAVAVGLGGWLTGGGDPARIRERAAEAAAAVAAIAAVATIER
jgi:2-dehydro-3-deoxyphosphogluconate aldolase/(4S)-4-hydroxy-2-oxoglutarate aldolase